jgi:YidC/Oxa1 family membrane protein insertase
VLIPLTIKQIRSMAAMQKIQPELKKLQAKHKGNRQKLNEEMMKLYREHGVNPLGGCFPLLMQAPVFIALYSVLRAAIPVAAETPQPVQLTIPIERQTFCHPEGAPRLGGANPTVIVCETKNQRQEFRVDSEWKERGKAGSASFVSNCGVRTQSEGKSKAVVGFECRSPVGTGHLPRDGDLFEDIIEDRTSIVGMHLACSPTQASSKTTIRQCAPSSKSAGGGALVGYYMLVALMAGTTYYQQRQMSARASGPQAKQMQLMGRIMPVFLGFISLNIPAGVIIYWIVSNLWTIGQQTIFFRRGQTTVPPPPAKPQKKGR